MNIGDMKITVGTANDRVRIYQQVNSIIRKAESGELNWEDAVSQLEALGATNFQYTSRQNGFMYISFDFQGKSYNMKVPCTGNDEEGVSVRPGGDEDVEVAIPAGDDGDNVSSTDRTPHPDPDSHTVFEQVDFGTRGTSDYRIVDENLLNSLKDLNSVLAKGQIYKKYN